MVNMVDIVSSELLCYEEIINSWHVMKTAICPIQHSLSHCIFEVSATNLDTCVLWQFVQIDSKIPFRWSVFFVEAETSDSAPT